MSYLVVVAKAGSGKKNRIYRGEDILRILDRIRIEHRTRAAVDWDAERDAYLRAHHAGMPRRHLAKQMSEKFGEMFTTGALLRRCTLLGLYRESV